MKDLIERLEKATGPDRELDGLIFQTIGGDAWRNAVLRASEPSGCPKDIAERKARERFAPLYTGSFDAAVTLTNGEPYLLAWSGQWASHMPRAGQPIYEAIIPDDTAAYEDTYIGDMGEIGPSGEGATPAIALCIACLRVRMSKR